jgi:hypothetical protein
MGPDKRKKIGNIEKVQNRAARFVFNNYTDRTPALAGVVLAGSWFQSLMVLGKNEFPKASLLVLS